MSDTMSVGSTSGGAASVEMSDPTRAGITRVQYLAGVLGLPHDAGADAVAQKAIEFQLKLEEQVLDLGRELKAQADTNLQVLAGLKAVNEQVDKLRSLVGLSAEADPIAVIAAAERELRSRLADSVLGTAGRRDVIDTKAREKPGLMEACVLMARLHEQVAGKNARVSTASYDVRLPEADALSIPALLVNLKDLEAVCIKSEGATPDIKG